jgi:hypothetical protein
MTVRAALRPRQSCEPTGPRRPPALRRSARAALQSTLREVRTAASLLVLKGASPDAELGRGLRLRRRYDFAGASQGPGSEGDAGACRNSAAGLAGIRAS